MEYSRYERGSEWRKWDLQVCTNKYTNYNGITLTGKTLKKVKELTGLTSEKINSDHKNISNEDYAKLYIEYLVNFTDINVIAITNHNTGEGIQEIITYLKSKQNYKEKDNTYNNFKIFPGVEIGGNDRCHVLIIFNPKTTINRKYIYNQNEEQIGEKTWNDFIDEFLNDIGIPQPRFLEIGKPCNSSNKGLLGILDKAKEWDFIVVLPHLNNSDGWGRELQENNKIETYRHKEFGIVDIKSIGNNTALKNILDGKNVIYGNKIIPKIITSDAKSILEIGNKFTWIKADPTFEGLKQILYEPEPGERVKIGQVEPDKKDPYKVISKIIFSNTNDFPNEIIFNNNLCSIIGSRSSGKSALLAYIAHAIDPEITEKNKEKGPGEGEDYSWENIKNSGLKYSATWKNNKENEDYPGKIVYLPQNYLFEFSKKPEEIKEKIKPVLYKKLPQFKEKYIQFEMNIKSINQEIKNAVEEWFVLNNKLLLLNDELKDYGNKNAIKNEKDEIIKDISNMKDKAKLSPEDLEQYQKASASLSNLKNKSDEIIEEQFKLYSIIKDEIYFKSITINLSPSIKNLPVNLQKEINNLLEIRGESILREINENVDIYKNKLESDTKENNDKIKEIKDKNKSIINRYKGYEELTGLINKINDYNDLLNKILKIEKEKRNKEEKIEIYLQNIKENIIKRDNLFKELVKSLNNKDKTSMQDIIYQIEYGIGNKIKD